MVSQDRLWTMIKEHPGRTVEYYAGILANGNRAKFAFYKEDIYSALSQLRKWKTIAEEWDFCESGPRVHYYPVNLIKKGGNLDYNPADYSSALVEDRLSRGWSEEAATYAFPSKANSQIKYLSKFNKGIIKFIRENEGCTFYDIGDYLCTAHRKCSYVPRCIFNAHLDVVLADLIANGNISVNRDKEYSFIKK